MSTHRQVPGLIIVELNSLYPNPDNPRAQLDDLDDLAASIAAQGIIQPLVVMPHPTKADAFTVLAGHRRLAAAELTGLDAVPCVLRKGRDTAASLEVALVENGQRKDLDPIEEARAIKTLMDTTGMSQIAVGRAMGRSSAHVSSRLSLLELTPSAQQQLKRGELSVSAGIAKATKRRGTNGSKPWNHYFSANHPLAAEARGICQLEHKRRGRLIGGQACGPCWSEAIRQDERALMASSAHVEAVSA